MIAYDINYDRSNNYPDASDDISHKECQPYYVTWCGDGVVDNAYEVCDAGANNGQIGQCNNTCSGVVPPNPVPGVCSSIVVGPQPLPVTV